MLPYNHDDTNRLYKIRPLIKKLNHKLTKVSLEDRLSVDEQMCSTKANSMQKRYLPRKNVIYGGLNYLLFVSFHFSDINLNSAVAKKINV